MTSRTDYRLMICVACLWPLLGYSSETYSRDSLDSTLYNYASKNSTAYRTGKLYSISLPSAFSSIDVWVIRVRARGLWKFGANHSSMIRIPPSVLPLPFVRRFDLVYQNLGNWSSLYYNNLPNDFKFVAPVKGFLAYDSNASSGHHRLIDLEVFRDALFVVKFPEVAANSNLDMKCVRFDKNGTLEVSNVTIGNSCMGRRQGHYSVVVIESKGMKWRKAWMIGIGVVVGFVGLVLVFVVRIRMCCEQRAMEEMEEKAETGAQLGTVWIGTSRMPVAPGMRTDPVIEIDDPGP